MKPCRPIACLLLALAAGALAACLAPSTQPGKGSAAAGDAGRRVLADFEKADPAVTWVPLDAAATATNAATHGASDTLPAASAPAGTEPAATSPAPSTAPVAQAAVLKRTSQNPQGGLWSMSAAVNEPGEIRLTLAAPANLRGYDLLEAQVSHADTAAHNGACTARMVLRDLSGKVVRGDACAVTSRWNAVTLDLRQAAEAGLDLSQIAAVGVEVRASAGGDGGGLLVLTDTWQARAAARKYQGDAALPRSFFVESRGDEIRAGVSGQYVLHVLNRGAPPDAQGATPSEGWLSITDGAGATRMGQPGTGLLLLDQAGLDRLGTARRQHAASAGGAGDLPRISWPASASPQLSSIRWNVVWTSTVGAIIEGRQEVGPYDRLGEPAVVLNWRLMIYQWGQVFVHVRWTKSGEVQAGAPVSWALALDPSLQRPDSDQTEGSNERVLESIYPPALRQDFASDLPHVLQRNMPVAMIARTSPRKDTFWMADVPGAGGSRRLFGAGIPGTSPEAPAGEADCMLLVNDPNGLMKAASFGQYLVPPKLTVRQGEQDRRFPGDSDEDGFVESYGFEPIRLANGRATFTINPQERPIFYPPFLFTIPAAERDAVDLKHSRLLVNVNGKQFADPPQFPDGSFLLQIPYQLGQERMNVEAVLVKK